MNFKERIFGKKEAAVKGLGERQLPQNPDASVAYIHRDSFSENARRLWEQRKYGGFAAAVLSDFLVKIELRELGPDETRLLGHSLIARLVYEDFDAVRQLPKRHPDRNAFAEIIKSEQERKNEIVDSMMEYLTSLTDKESAQYALWQISLDLRNTVETAKRLYFRNLTPEVGPEQRDNLIASQIKRMVERLASIKDKVLDASERTTLS